MIEYLDNIMRDLLLDEIPALTDESQIRFQQPDEDWRTYVSGLGDRMALNLYLADLRENRKLRSNERIRTIEEGIVYEEPAPPRMDCHYLITAWSPAEPSPAIEPTLDEHELLYMTTAVLMNSAPINPSRVYPPGSAALTAVPEVIRNADLPTSILPVEGFPKLAEFWGTMGVNHRWKPGIYLVVTLPVVLEKEISGPIVTTRITEYRHTGRPETAEVWIQIGGHVLDEVNRLEDGSPAPVVGAWVALESSLPPHELLQTTETNALGRFTFGDLHGGSFRLRVRAVGHVELSRGIEVPSPTGEYDFHFT